MKKTVNSIGNEFEVNENFFPGVVKEIINEYRIIVTDYNSNLSVGDVIYVIEISLPIESEDGKINDYFYFDKAELKVTGLMKEHAICFSNEEVIVKGSLSHVIEATKMPSTFSDKVVTKKLYVDEPLGLKVRDRKIKRGDFYRIKDK